MPRFVGERNLNLRAFVAVALVVSLYVALVSAPTGTVGLGVANSLSITFSGGSGVLVTIDSVNPAPRQGYSFNVNARSLSPGSSITKISWQFGDGASLDVQYCCQSQVRETQFHTYARNSTYTVSVVAYDNMGNFAYAQAVINWTPVESNVPTITITA